MKKQTKAKSDFIQIRLKEEYIYKLDFLKDVYNTTTYSKLIKKIIDIELLRFNSNIDRFIK